MAARPPREDAGDRPRARSGKPPPRGGPPSPPPGMGPPAHVRGPRGQPTPSSTRGGGASRLQVALGVVLLGVALAGGVGAGLYDHYVVRAPGPAFSEDHLKGLVADEALVLFRDGTPMGAFFEDEHRQVVAWSDLPPVWVAAIVAAEDEAFFHHPGFSVKHIVRAARDNLLAGRLVAGGSTLTQQTAKNLFYRPDRSLGAKLSEAVAALRLEAHYDKHEILELYANQFHVSGNGRGLGIAARHFFDKDPGQLTTLEAAYLAGLVKGPSNYDPFLGDAARQAATLARARARTAYVLRRLTEVDAERVAGPVVTDEASSWQAYADPSRAGETLDRDTAAARRLKRVGEVRTAQREAAALLRDGFELPFSRGTFRWDDNAVVDEVRRRLSAPPLAAVLAEHGIADPSSAGLRVHTTLDPVAQRVATYALWHHLTEVGTWLEGGGPEAFARPDAAGPRYDRHRPPEAFQMRSARVVGAPIVADRRVLDLDLGGFPCRVDRDGLVRAAVALARHREGSAAAKTNTAEVEALIDALPAGAVVLASVRRGPSEGGPALCDLERRPRLQGAALVLEQGQVRAMVGGNDNRNFNRATALRQLGSTWKPVVFHAALRLGWSPLDVLDNRPTVFPYSTSAYAPRADHEPEDFVSLAWAGVRSENIASVWLLVHLLDPLAPEALQEVAAAYGLLPGEGEAPEDYRVRLQRLGVGSWAGASSEALFIASKLEVARAWSDRLSDEALAALRSLPHGRGLDAATLGRAGVSGAPVATWMAARPRLADCRAAADAFSAAVAMGVRPPISPGLWLLDEEGGATLSCVALPGAAEAAVAAAAWGEDPAAWPRLAPVDATRVTPRLDLAVLEEVESALKRRESLAVLDAGGTDLYSPDVIIWAHDFRVRLALEIVTALGRELGVTTALQPVLSLPLGASEVSLEEITAVYGGLVSGEAWRFPGEQDPGLFGGAPVDATPDRALLIARITDASGKVIYEATPTSSTSPLAAEAAALTADILRLVVAEGTGRSARGAVTVGGKPLPLLGKTGTTNDFRNAAFVGRVPALADGALDLGRGWDLGVYVGYDDNTAMRHKRIRLDGARGALPAWSGIAAGLVGAGALGEPGAAPPDGWRWPVPDTLVAVAVDPDRGGQRARAAADGAPTVLTRDPAAPLRARASVNTALDAPPRELPHTPGDPGGPADLAGREAPPPEAPIP